MTLERILTAEAQDVKAVVLVCKACGTIQGYDPIKWNGSLAYGCPNCPGARQWKEGPAYPSVESLLTSLRKIGETETLPFEIRLQFKALTDHAP
jgi:hypothetical protein